MSRRDHHAPVLIYDGDCGFCRGWIERWRRSTGDRVRYVPYQRRGVLWRHGVRRKAARAAAQLVEADGRRYQGAPAMLRALGRAGSPWVRLAAQVGLMPGVRRAAGLLYRYIAAHRQAASRVQRRIERVLGPAVPRHRFWAALSRAGLARRGLGAIYLIAFTSLGAQVLGLHGERGILPVRELLQRLREALNEPEDRKGSLLAPLRAVPSLLWLDDSDRGLVRLCRVGQIAGAALALGLAPRLAAATAWCAYLSLVSASPHFLGFQWDILLLEAGVQALLGQRGRLLTRTLAFRLQLESGLAKLASHDRTWRDLSACCYHQETQPLPTPIGWYAHHLPRRAQRLGSALTLFIECVVPFLGLAPRRLRRVGFTLLTGFQGLIALTGNYGFFNWLTCVLNLTLLEQPPRGRVSVDRRPAVRALAALENVAAGTLLVLGIADLARRLRPRLQGPAALDRLESAVAPFRIVGSYGLFSVMTTTRPEIVIEGSDDGRTWREYEFRYKPGDVRRAPRWVAPHQPRLDWQMWFAALGDPPGWFVRFLERLLEGSPDVLGLLATNPFPAHPPAYVRALLYDYKMADLATHRRTGAWWVRTRVGTYFSACALRPSTL